MIFFSKCAHICSGLPVPLLTRAISSSRSRNDLTAPGLLLHQTPLISGIHELLRTRTTISRLFENVITTLNKKLNRTCLNTSSFSMINLSYTISLRHLEDRKWFCCFSQIKHPPCGFRNPNTPCWFHG
jgi:hypothetical protein